jgi:hypothetical protein
MQQIANILEQPISPQTLPRKNRKRPYNLVLFIPVGAGMMPACTVHVKKKLKIFTSSSFPTRFSRGICTYLCMVCNETNCTKNPTKINTRNQIDIFELF